MNRIPLSQVCNYSDDSVQVSELNLNNFISTDNMLPNRGGITEAVNLPPANSCSAYSKGEILISNIRPYFKKIWFAEFDGGCSADVLVLKTTNPKFDPKFVYYNLFQDLFFKHQMTGSKGSKMPRGDKDQIMTFLIPEFDKSYQKRVSEFLTVIDEKIALNKKINTELENLAKTIYNYWFVQFDFPNAAGKPYKTSGGEMEWNEELKREIPKGWRVNQIEDIANVKAGGDKPKTFSIERTLATQVPIYSNGIENDGLYGFTDAAIISKQSVTISARGTIGHCILRNSPFTPIIRLIVVTPKVSGRASYLYQYFNSMEYFRNGSVQQQLTVPEVNSLKVLLPSECLLEKFNEITTPFIQERDSINNENQELIKLRDFLLPMLMNGQVKVKSEAKEQLSMAAEPQVKYGE